MTRKDQIELLISEVDESYTLIENIFQKSIRERELDNKVYIKIKNYLENLRAILDFLAKEILNKYCSKQVRNYFPIFNETLSDQKIGDGISGRFPNLENTRPELYDYLKNIQPKYDVNNRWLFDLNELCGSNKHDTLTLQVRKDKVINKLTFKGGRTLMWTDGLVEFRNNNDQMVFKPSGQGSISVNPSFAIEDDHFVSYGWIVEKLDDFKLTSSPDLSKYDKENYTLDSFLIGNFYFANHILNACAELKTYLCKVVEVKEKIYSML